MIVYRKLTGYKYQLMKFYSIRTDIKINNKIVHTFFEIHETGKLCIRKGYCWDGPSGPTFDTESFMRGSLVHDVLYQSFRERLLPIEYKEYADNLLRKICIEDGMSELRAWYVYWAVKLFAKGCAEPKKELL